MAKQITYELWEKSLQFAAPAGGFQPLADEPEYTQLVEWYERVVMIATRNDCSGFTLNMMKRIPSGLMTFRVVPVLIVPNKDGSDYHHHAVGVMYLNWAVPIVVFDPIERTASGQGLVRAIPSTWKRYKAIDWKYLCGTHFSNLFGWGAGDRCIYQDPTSYIRRGVGGSSYISAKNFLPSNCTPW